MCRYWVYIVESKDNVAKYIGVINDIRGRVAEHKCGQVLGFPNDTNAIGSYITKSMTI